MVSPAGDGKKQALAGVDPLPELLPRYRLKTPTQHWSSLIMGAILAVALVVTVLATGLPFVMLLVGYLAFFSYLVTRRMRSLKAASASQGVMHHLRAGRYKEAGELCELLIDQTQHESALRSILIMNRAVTLLRTGNLPLATTLVREVERSEWLTRKRSAFRGLFYQNALLINALLGDLVEAARLRPLAAATAKPNADLVLAEAIVALRSNATADAIAMTNDVDSKLVRLVRAYALSTTNDTTEVNALIEASRPTETSEVDWLAASWPDLRSFLQKNRVLPLGRERRAEPAWTRKS